MRIEPQVTYRYRINDDEVNLSEAQLVHLVGNMLNDYMDRLEICTIVHGEVEYAITKKPGHDWNGF